ncbi:MAG: sulfur carrier protein ThiS [Burkholderiales bacterium]
MALTVNGLPQTFASPLNIAELIAALDLQGKRVAVERNGEIVPRSRFLLQGVEDGDTLEIVAAVGGG